MTESHSLPLLVPSKPGRPGISLMTHDEAAAEALPKLPQQRAAMKDSGGPRNTNWRQHDLFRFMSETSHQTTHENTGLRQRLAELEGESGRLRLELTKVERELKAYRRGDAVPGWVVNNMEQELKKEEAAGQAVREECEKRLVMASEEAMQRQLEAASARAEYDALRTFVHEDLILLNHAPSHVVQHPDAALKSASELGSALAHRRTELEQLRKHEAAVGRALADEQAKQVSEAIRAALREYSYDQTLPPRRAAVSAGGTRGGTQPSQDGAPSDEAPCEPEHVRQAGRQAAREAAVAHASPDEIVLRAQQAAAVAMATPFTELAKEKVRARMDEASADEGGVDGEQVSAHEAEAAVQAARAVAALRGEDGHEAEARTREALAKGYNAAEAAAAGIGQTAHQAAAATAAAFQIGERYPEAEPLAAAAAAHAASFLVAEGAEASVAASNGVRAATIVMEGGSLEQVNAHVLATAAAVVDGRVSAEDNVGSTARARGQATAVPRWTLEGWISSLSFNGLISAALMKRLREAVGASDADADATQAFEESFVRGLAIHGSVETVHALLQETPVLYDIAEAIFAHATQLNDARLREQRKAQLELEAKRKAEAKASSSARTHSHGAGPLVDVRRSNEGLRKAGMVTHAITNLHYRMNAEFIAHGARTLFFSKDESLYWEGLSRLVGPPNEGAQPLAIAIEEEHSKRADSDVAFTAHNYGTCTTSRIEWAFVHSPSSLKSLTPYLTAIGAPSDAWPATTRSVDSAAVRKPVAFEQPSTKATLLEIDAKLGAHGEQPVSKLEWAVLRAYTGPLYVKYNGVLRAALAGDFEFLDNTLMGNRYPTTLHVLAAAILKLGTLTTAQVVYRAPGGALPSNFWKRSTNGTIGFIEVGCLSASTDKQEALEYARRSKAGLVFELELGFVGKGADIGWLSQYPKEREIVLPPVCALEVIGSRIEGHVVFVSVKPSMLKPAHVRTGADDLFFDQVVHRRQQVEDATSAVARGARVSRALRQARHHVSLKTAEARLTWQKSLLEAKLASALAVHERTKAKLAETNFKLASERLARTSDTALHAKVSKDLEKLGQELETCKKACVRAKIAAQRAQETEQTAAKMLQYAYSSEGSPHLARTRTQEVVAEHKQQGPKLDIVTDIRIGEEGILDTPGVTRERSQRDISGNVNLKHVGTLRELASALEDALDRGSTSFAVAALERVVEICMADEVKPKLKDPEKIEAIKPVTQVMKGWGVSMVVQAIGACALACLTRSAKPYPRAFQSAADEANCIALLADAQRVLGNAFDQPVREAIGNIVKNDKALTSKALGAGMTWLSDVATGPPSDAPLQRSALSGANKRSSEDVTTAAPSAASLQVTSGAAKRRGSTTAGAAPAAAGVTRQKK